MARQLSLLASSCTPPRAGHRERRRPEETPLYAVVHEHLESFLAQAERHERTVPRFVERELRSYLECGLLQFGFARLRCESCGYGRLVAFSCKGRAFCPSCMGRRMSDTAAHLVDRVLPEVPVRQWVLSLPHALRYRLAYDHRLCSAVLRLFIRAVFGALQRRARAAWGESPLLAELCAASVRGRIATGPRAGRPLLRLGDRIDVEDVVAGSGPRCANVGGVSLHADVCAPARDRKRLERLCRYVSRPPIASERLSRLTDGRVLYRLKRR